MSKYGLLRSKNNWPEHDGDDGPGAGGGDGQPDEVPEYLTHPVPGLCLLSGQGHQDGAAGDGQSQRCNNILVSK